MCKAFGEPSPTSHLLLDQKQGVNGPMIQISVDDPNIIHTNTVFIPGLDRKPDTQKSVEDMDCGRATKSKSNKHGCTMSSPTSDSRTGWLNVYLTGAGAQKERYELVGPSVCDEYKDQTIAGIAAGPGARGETYKPARLTRIEADSVCYMYDAKQTYYWSARWLEENILDKILTRPPNYDCGALQYCKEIPAKTDGHLVNMSAVSLPRTWTELFTKMGRTTVKSKSTRLTEG